MAKTRKGAPRASSTAKKASRSAAIIEPVTPQSHDREMAAARAADKAKKTELPQSGEQTQASQFTGFKLCSCSSQPHGHLCLGGKRSYADAYSKEAALILATEAFVRQGASKTALSKMVRQIAASSLPAEVCDADVAMARVLSSEVKLLQLLTGETPPFFIDMSEK